MADNILNNPQFTSFAQMLEQSRGLPSGLLPALIAQESGGNPNAVSKAGAQGLAQFMPATAKEYNVDVTNPWDSTRGAADYLGDLVKQYGGNVQAALAHYNGGTAAGKAVAAGQQPPSVETQKYVPSIMARLQAQPATQATAQAQPQAPDFSQITPDVVAQTRGVVENMVQKGLAPDLIVNTLANSVNKPVVAAMKANGYTDADIINEIGGKKVQDINAANAQVKAEGFGENVLKGAVNAVGDTWNGVKQLAARAGMGDLKELQQEQAAKLADPVRQAQDRTAGSAIGGVLPIAAALAIPGVGEAGIGETLLGTAARQAAIGGAMGAVTPTRGDGQIIPNIVGGAALGGVVGGAAHGVGNVLGAVGEKLAAGGNAEGKQAALAKAINERIGQDATVVNSDVSAAAHGDIGDMFKKAAQGQDIKIPQGFAGDVTKMTEALDTTPKVVGKLTAMADGSTVSAQDLLNVRSTLVGKMRSPSIDGADKQVLSDVVDHIDDTLNSSLPKDKQEILSKARDQYRHLMTVDNMIAKTNDSGVLTPSAFNSAIKQGSNKGAFVQGKAPYQDLQDMANALKETQSPLSKLSESMGTVLAVHHPAISIAKNALEAFGGSVTKGAGKALGLAGDSLSPAQSAALARALIERSRTADTQQATDLSHAITSTAPIAPAAIQAQASVAQQRSLADALAQKAAASAQAAGLAPQAQAPQPQMSPAMQQALAAALAQRAK